MKANWKERLTLVRMKDEFVNSACVAGGLLGASLLDRLIEKAVDNYLPTAKQYIGPIKAAVQVAAGVVISSLNDNPKIKMVGYGVAASGFMSGARLIPAVDQFFSGLGSTQTNNLEVIDLGLVGIQNGQAHYSIDAAPAVDVNLQDPQGSNSANYAYSENSFAGNEVEEESTADII